MTKCKICTEEVRYEGLCNTCVHIYYLVFPPSEEQLDIMKQAQKEEFIKAEKQIE